MRLLPLSTFAQRLDEAASTLQVLGVRIGGTRVARYQAIIRRAAAAEDRGETTHQHHPAFVNALIEASELLDIATLDSQDIVSDHARQKLAEISSGPEVMAPDANDPARDYAFEFSTAARAKSNGRFRGFPESGDLAIAPNDLPVECKRVSSLKQLERRLKGARDQLLRRSASGEMPGIVAIDMTRPIRLAQGNIIAANDDSLMETAEQHLTAYIAHHLIGRQYIEALAVPSVLGILVRYLAAGTAGDPGHIRRSTVWQACSLHPDESEQNVMFLSAAEFLGPEPVRHITWSEIDAAAIAVDAAKA